MGDDIGYFCTCIKSMAVSRADFDAQSDEVRRLREALDAVLPMAEAYVMQVAYRDAASSKAVCNARDLLGSQP